MRFGRRRGFFWGPRRGLWGSPFFGPIVPIPVPVGWGQRGGGNQEVMARMNQAQELAAAGQYDQAAAIYDELGQIAESRGLIQPTARMALGAAQCYVQMGNSVRALNRAERAVTILATNGQTDLAARALGQMSRALRQQGFTAQAQALEKEMLAKYALRPAQATAPSGQPRNLPAQCPHCGAPLRPSEIDWLDATTVECPYCGSILKAG